MPIDLKAHLNRTLTPALLIDLEDAMRAEAAKAHAMVHDHAGLNRKRSRELEGQARFRMMEERFEAVCQIHGGLLLTDGVIPNTDRKVYQPFMRFQSDGRGVIFGLAAMPEPKKIPAKNLSRTSGVSLNYHFSQRLDLDGTGPKVGDLFALFLVARDRERAGKIEELAVGVIESAYNAFLFYQPLDQFLAHSADMTDMSQPSELVIPKVTLKREVRPFQPPEQTPARSEGTGSA